MESGTGESKNVRTACLGDEGSILCVLEDFVGHELNFRALLDAIRDGLLIIDASGSCVDANRTCCRILKSSREQLIGVPFKDLLLPETAARSEEFLQSLRIEDGRGRKFPLLARDGTPVSVEWIRSTEYQPGLHLCTFAEKKAADESIRDSEVRYRTLAESLPQLVWTALPDGWCDYLSSQWVTYTGIPEADQLGYQWLERVMHPEDRDQTRVAWTRAVSDLAAYDLEFRLRRHDGAYRWFKTRGTPVRNGTGQIVKWFGTCTDIDDQKNMAEERQALWVRERTARARAEILNQVGVLISSELDGQKLAQRVTDLATQLLGAEFGASSNVTNEVGESYTLYTLSGAPHRRSLSSRCRATPRCSAPPFVARASLAQMTSQRTAGMVKTRRIELPEGHLPSGSYLAAPVISRLGENLGGLFFGTSKVGVFTEEHEELIRGLASHAAIALDNAMLFRQLGQEKNRAQGALATLQRANEELRPRERRS